MSAPAPTSVGAGKPVARGNVAEGENEERKMKIIFKVCPDLQAELLGKIIPARGLVLLVDKLIYNGSRGDFHNGGAYDSVMGIFGSFEATEKAAVSYEGDHLDWWEVEEKPHTRLLDEEGEVSSPMKENLVSLLMGESHRAYAAGLSTQGVITKERTLVISKEEARELIEFTLGGQE